jgi:hypothetical protein
MAQLSRAMETIGPIGSRRHRQSPLEGIATITPPK